MARAHEWLDRLMELAQFETMVLRRSGQQRQLPFEARRDRERPVSSAGQ